jgi:hypothetical protein
MVAELKCAVSATAIFIQYVSIFLGAIRQSIECNIEYIMTMIFPRYLILNGISAQRPAFLTSKLETTLVTVRCQYGCRRGWLFFFCMGDHGLL